MCGATFKCATLQLEFWESLSTVKENLWKKFHPNKTFCQKTTVISFLSSVNEAKVRVFASAMVTPGKTQTEHITWAHLELANQFHCQLEEVVSDFFWRSKAAIKTSSYSLSRWSKFNLNGCFDCARLKVLLVIFPSAISFNNSRRYSVVHLFILIYLAFLISAVFPIHPFVISIFFDNLFISLRCPSDSCLL